MNANWAHTNVDPPQNVSTITEVINVNALKDTRTILRTYSVVEVSTISNFQKEVDFKFSGELMRMFAHLTDNIIEFISYFRQERMFKPDCM